MEDQGNPQEMAAMWEVLNGVRARATSLHDAAYKNWLEKLTTLSLSALTLLVSLQNTYVPGNPQGRWLLSCTWGLLALATIAGLLALFGESQAHRKFLKAVEAIRTKETKYAPDPPKTAAALILRISQIRYERPFQYLLSAAITAIAVGLSVVFLAAFAILNFQQSSATQSQVLHPGTPPKTPP